MTFKLFKTIGIAAVAGLIGTVSVFAGPITDRIAGGKTIKLGFSNIPIWAFPGENEKPEGFVHEIVLGTLKKTMRTLWQNSIKHRQPIWGLMR